MLQDMHSLWYRKNYQSDNWQYLCSDQQFICIFLMPWNCMELITAPIYTKKFQAEQKAYFPTGLDL
jgi:hypothetical protein